MARIAAFGTGAVTVCAAGIAALVGLGYVLEGDGLVVAALLLPPLIIALVVQMFSRHDRVTTAVSLYLVYSFVMGAALLSVTIGAAANTEFNALAAVFAQLALWRASVVLDAFASSGALRATRRLGFAALLSAFLTIAAIGIFVAMLVTAVNNSRILHHLHELAPFALAYAIASFALLLLLLASTAILVVRIVRMLRAKTGDVRRLQWIAPGLLFGSAMSVAIVIVSAYGVVKVIEAYSAYAGNSHRVGALAAPDWFTTSCVVVGIAAQALLAYAILSRRIVDIRYYIARGTTFTILLGMIVVGVSLIEFTLERVFDALGGAVPNVKLAVSASAAVGLSFFAQRLHQATEHRVQHLLFRDRYHLLSALRSFRASIYHFCDEGTLIESASSVLRERTRCDATVIALRDSTDRLRIESGDAAGTIIPDDDPLAVELRERTAPVDAEGLGSALGSGSAFPCALRGQLFGIVLLRRCAQAEAFAPDELAAIADVVTQIGLATDALRAARLRAIVNQVLADRLGIGQLESLLSAEESVRSR